MKKYFLLLAGLTFSLIIKAQNVAINADGSVANASAMLDIKNPNKGLLIPRVTLTGTTDAVTIPTPAISLLVYNTASTTGATAVTPGFYYWNGMAWTQLGAGSSSPTGNAWLLTGNGSTVDGMNFIGTTDNVPFNIRVNNQRAGRIDATLSNTFWGYQAGLTTTGNYNTATGSGALYSNTFGEGNNAFGSQALFSNTTGYQNIAIGGSALRSNTTGINNTATGSQALFSNTTAQNNTANGFSSLRDNTIGFNNTSIGTYTSTLNTTGSNNTAIGTSALYSNSEGNNNTATGFQALYSNRTANGNSAYGYKSLFSNVGAANTANGYESLLDNVNGSFNTAIGQAALHSNSSGNFNTATGYGALRYNTVTGGNTAYGFQALSFLINGSNNTALGNGADINQNNLNNTTALGAGARVYNSNQVQIGNEFVTDVFFGNPNVTKLWAGSYNIFSDKRVKYNIQSNVPGLEFIKRLSPVTYYLDDEKIDAFRKTGILNNSIVHTASYKDKKQLHTGFLAQDVEKTAKELGYSFDGVHAPENDKDLYSISYSQFTMPLVKAVQEQQLIIEDQQVQINKLKKENEEMKVLKAAVQELTKKVNALIN